MQQFRKNLGKVSLTAEGVWDVKSKYDVLSIVYDEHTQHGFISKQPVPIGVDLYNSEYWMPLNVSGYTDSNIIILNKKSSDASIETYTLEEAIKSITSVGRKPGCILGFYNSNVNRLDIGGRWEIWQFNSTTVSEWEDLTNWQNIYYNYNQFVGWYRNEEQLKINNPYPEIGCYAYVGNILNEAVVYRCEIKHKWTETIQHAWDYIKVMIDGTVTVGENGNWYNNGEDTGIPANIKGDPGLSPFIRYNTSSNKLEYSYDKVKWIECSDYISTWFRLNNNKLEMSRDNANWNPVSDYIAAWFRWQATAGDTQANNVGRIQMSRDNGKTWTNMSNDFTNNLHISRYIGVNESLPTSGIAEGTIYAKGPYYAEGDTLNDNPIYRLWVYAWKGDTLAWQDNGEFTGISAGIVQETGDSETEVMSQKAVTRKLSDVGSEIEFGFGIETETILTSTTLAYNIDIKPRTTDYQIVLLVTSNRIGQVPIYKTTNGVQDDGALIDIGAETLIDIPANTTRLRFVRTGLTEGDIFHFVITEKTELRNKVDNIQRGIIEDNSLFIPTFNVDKGTAFNPTEQIKKAVKYIKLYDYTDEFYNIQIGLSECRTVNKIFNFVIWDYTNNKQLVKLVYDLTSVSDVNSLGKIILGGKNVKVEVCFDLTDFDFTLGGIASSTSANDYEHRGINLDKCIKVKLQSLRGILLPTASFVKGGFDITRMVSNSIKYLKSLDVNTPIPNIGLSELIYYTSNKMLSVKLWDFTNDVELCKFAEYYDSPKVSDVKISTNGKWEICFDLSEVNFDVYSVTSDNLDSPFTYEARGIDTNCILLPHNLEDAWLNRKIEDYTDFPGGVIRKTTNKIEQSSGAWGFLYFPVKANTKYRIIGNDVNVYAAAWAVIAFSSALPTNGGVVSVIKSFETEGYVDFDMNYTPNEDGYLCASYFHSEGFQGTYSVYKFIEQKSIGTYQYPSVYEGISKGLSEFKVGDITFKGNTTRIAPFAPNAFAKQYEVQYAKYMNNSDGKKYSRMIVQDVVNMFDESLDAADFKDSYCRQVIGVDSEGWAYIAQRFAMYDFETDANTKILRTKDFNTFETFMDGVAGVQLIELDNGELCFAANSTDTYDGVTGYFCNIYVTSNNKKSINKKFHTTRTSGAVIGQPWSWGVQSRGSVIAISEYGAHGKVGSVWYSRDFGNTFYHVFEHSKYAPNYPNAHIHGICVDPYFDRLYVITGDSGRNSRIYWWDYNRETLNNELWNTIEWKFIETAMDIHSGSSFQFVCGYALKDCVILGSDGQRGGIFRLNRGKKEDIPVIDYGVDFGLAENGQFSTVWCGGNMFKLNDDSPLLICIHREASNDLEPNDPNNPNGYANTYRTVRSKVYATYNGYDFTMIWEDDTFGGYDVFVDGVKVTKTLAKCGRDMSIYQLPNNNLLLKYIGRAFSYIGFNNNGKTDTTKEAYHRFNNYVVRGRLK